MDTMQSIKFLERCRGGDADAIQDLVSEHEKALYRLALSILDDPAEADEATQDAFLAVLKRLDTFRGDSSFTTWIYRITVNLCRDRLRKRRSKEKIIYLLRSIFWLDGISPAIPEDSVIQREANSALWKAVDALGEKHRLPVILYYYHDLPVTEIAKILNLSTGTILSRLYAAREKLRLVFEGTWNEKDEYE